MSIELNQAIQKNPSRTLLERTALIGWAGWVLFVLMLLAFIVQSIAFSFSPRQILTADPVTGQLNGLVVFNDVIARDDATVKRDLKAWVSARLSLNSSTIYEDATIALNHLCSQEQEALLADWRKTAYLAQIEQSKGVSKVEFSNDSVEVHRDKVGNGFTAMISGDTVIGIVDPQRLPFKLEVKGDLFPKTESNTLGLEVCEYADI